MTFNSAAFLVFLPLVFALYWLLQRGNLRWQNWFVLVASCFFYGWWDWRFLGLVVLGTATDYGIGLWLEHTENQPKRKRILIISLLLNLGLLAFFKYFNFFAESFVALANDAGWKVSDVTLNIILPVGISFYTFQSLSYTIDVYRKRLPAVRDFVAFAAFVTFFPQLVAGPIERATHLLPQFMRRRFFDYEKAVSGCRLMLWGFLKKVVLADNLASIVSGVFDHPAGQNGWTVALGTICFALQVYGDFSGYSDIAVGSARLFGFDLMQNFRTPYFAVSMREFWQRWHISLSTWFRDYVYAPLGGNRNGAALQVRNLLITFVLSGLWHGANWTFVLWGVWHGVLVSLENIFQIPPPRGRAMRVLCGLAVFVLVCLGWIFFRAKDLPTAWALLSYLTHFPANGWTAMATLFPSQAKLLALTSVILLFLWLEWLGHEGDINLLFAKAKRPVRWAAYYLIVMVILLLGAFDNAPVFIYFSILMLKKFLLNLALFAVPLLVAVTLLPLDKGFAWRFVKGDCYGHGAWLWHRLSARPEPADVAFVGSSHTIHIAWEKAIEDSLSTIYEKKLQLLNLGYCRLGNNLPYAVLKNLLKFKDPKLVVWEVREDEDCCSHRMFGYLADGEDVWLPAAFPHERMFNDWWNAATVRVEYWQDRLFNEGQMGTSIDASLYGYASDVAVADSAEMAALKAKKAKTHPPDEWVQPAPFPRVYLEKSIALLRKRGIRFAFLYAPEYGNPRHFPLTLKYLEEIAPVWIPPQEVLDDPANWADRIHLNNRGAAALSGWLAKRIAESL